MNPDNTPTWRPPPMMQSPQSSIRFRKRHSIAREEIVIVSPNDPRREAA
jgi:hypothetical protein